MIKNTKESTRRVAVGQLEMHPRYVIWELTLQCDQRCAHCGSRAGDVRDSELPIEKALDVVAQLKAMGTKDVVLMGGEAYLYSGFIDVVAALNSAGMTTSMVTGGGGMTRESALAMKKAGMQQVSVSIDGTALSHDLIRASKGSHQAALKALDYVMEAGMTPSSNMSINRVNLGDVGSVFELLVQKGVRSWQIQITTPMGRAADRPEMILQPYDLIDLMPRLAAVKAKAFKEGLLMMPGNNLGYFGPEETLLRSMSEKGVDHWMGCSAGKYVMGIESNGGIKGCLTLQSQRYVGGNVKESSVKELWESTEELATFRSRTVDDLWGYCRECIFAENCMGGCGFTSFSLFGRMGNNPYCHYRARTLAKSGVRERLVSKQAPNKNAFDGGLFDLVVEDYDYLAHSDSIAIKNVQNDLIITSDDELNSKRRSALKKKKVRLLQKHYS